MFQMSYFEGELGQAKGTYKQYLAKCELQTSQTSCTAIRAEYLGRIYKTKFIDDPGIEDTRE